MKSKEFNHTKKGGKCLNLNKSKVFRKQIKLSFALKKTGRGSVKSFTDNGHNLKCQM